jgi:hypothetical protein
MTHLNQKLLVIAALLVSFTMQAAEPEDKFRRGLIEPEQWMTADKVEGAFGRPFPLSARATMNAPTANDGITRHATTG